MARTVFFDVDGVLVHGYHARPELQQRWDETLLADLGVDPDEFRKQFIYGIFVEQVIVGKLALVEALERVLPSVGYKGSPMNFMDYWLTHDSRVNTELIDAIRRVRAKTDAPFYIATNQEHMRAQWLWQTLGFKDVFDDIYYSARLGVMKPDPAYFAAIEARVGPFSEPPLFFDDTPKVVESAREAGWEAVIVNGIDDVLTHPWIAERV